MGRDQAKIRRHEYKWTGSIFLCTGERRMTHFCDPADVDKLEEQIEKMKCCENCASGPRPCKKCYGAEPEETRCNPNPEFPFYMAQWEMKE